MALQRPLTDLYNSGSIDQWSDTKTMEHASGIWGRRRMLEYLKYIIKQSFRVVDLGAGAGYPTKQLVTLVGPNGTVIGVENNNDMLKEARQYQGISNLKFRQGDITQRVPIEGSCVDVVTAFMVAHNLLLDQLEGMFEETVRILRRGGKAAYLTMHPLALESEWQLTFMEYDASAIRQYRAASDKENMSIPGRVRNAGSDEWKKVRMIHHTEENFLEAAKRAGLSWIEGIDISIDQATAEEKFGPGCVVQLPTTPTFWIAVFKKK